MIPEVGKNVKDFYTHPLRENNVSYAQPVGSKRMCCLQPDGVLITFVERFCTLPKVYDKIQLLSGGEQMVTDEPGTSCSIGPHQETKKTAFG